MPDEDADPAVTALVDLSGFDDLLLKGCRDPPVHHVAGAFVLVGSSDKAGIMRTQARSEHAGTPGPPGLHEVLVVVGQPHDVQAGMVGLLLTGIGDLRDGWHLPFSGLPDASVVAVTNREDGAISPNTATLGRLHRDLQVLVEVDPATPTRALVGQGVLGHEVVGGLHTDANVGLISSVGQLDLLPEVLVLGVIAAAVELLDAAGVHVLRAIVGSTVWQRSQAARQEVNDGQLDIWEEMLDLRGPLHTNEPGTDDENCGLLLVQILQLVVLLQNMTAAALEEALVDVLPVTDGPPFLMDCREPKALAHGLEGPKIAA
mmetsp:Transcript_44451/g.91895  ORF Transcript_44451/g.91895 Transcript_44451/m.91895 type:complete len:317 (-) Transcript_44451:400-1350(-)